MTRPSHAALAALLTLTLSAPALRAETLHVSASTGAAARSADGSKEKPFRDLQAAIDKANEGDTLHIAAGNYLGKNDQGFITLDKSVSLVGGWNTDFTERDPLKHRTMIQPTAAQNPSASGDALVTLGDKNKPRSFTAKDLVMDGLILDRGFSNGYHPTKGKAEGLDTGMLIHPPGQGVNGDQQKVVTNTRPLIYFANGFGNVTIRNCALVNGAFYGVLGSWSQGKVLFENNLFVNNGYAGAELSGGGQTGEYSLEVEFANNTILFNWARTNDLQDMGYGVRFMLGAKVLVHDCILGCSTMGALDRGRVESGPGAADREKKRVTGVENSAFFLNKNNGDLVLPGGAGWKLIPCAKFEDCEELDPYEGNAELDGARLKGKINEAYLNAFLTMQNTEDVLLDRDSPANKFRSALGMSLEAAANTKVDLYANRYPLEDALKLFGAVEGVGAQKP